MTWKKIEGYPMYALSSSGNVKNLNTGKILKPKERFDGYLEVTLSKDNVSSSKKIHRLVAENFLTKPSGAGNWIVNHKDNNRTHNSTSNLEWITKSENNKKENQDDEKNDYQNVSKDRTFSSRAFKG